MRHGIAALLIVFLSSGVFAAQPAANDRNLLALQREQTKLKTQADPIAQTKTRIKIANALLNLVADAVKNGNTPEMEKRLTDYVSTIESARQTMVQTGRDAVRKAGGFKELEIALRQQMNQLKDIGGALTFDERAPVEKARDRAAAIRDELIKSLFGEIHAKPGY